MAALVNAVYTDAEGGLWVEGRTRTAPEEVAELIAAGEVSVVRAPDGTIVGSVCVETIDEHTALFGMLAVDPDHRGGGLGRALVDHAEDVARRSGDTTMQLELLVPTTWTHPSKARLARWYGTLGYAVVWTRPVEDVHAFLVPHLVTPCAVQLWEKPLR